MKNQTTKKAKHERIFQRASIESHLAAWNHVAHRYAGGAALPGWGPRNELHDQQILPPIKNKRILEIGFGSGDSIIYLLKNGAGHVTGIDFSRAQLKIARHKIASAFKTSNATLNKASLILQSMDEKLPDGPFDFIIAIYSIGWSEHPERLLKNIYNMLKPGGHLYFSWDHYMGRIVEQLDNNIVVTKSYHEPMPLVRENWKGSGSLIETHQLRPSDWFHMLAGAGFTIDGFWEPKPDQDIQAPEICSSMYSPAISEIVPTCVVFSAKKEL